MTWGLDTGIQPPTAQKKDSGDREDDPSKEYAVAGVDVGDDPPANTRRYARRPTEDLNWLTIARESFRSSSSYFDTNWRKKVEDGVNAFNSQHANDSKYATAAYAKRSHVYRPKMRSIERRMEAAAASAFFSNADIIDIQPENQTDPIQAASASVLKHLLQYRLDKHAKWFPFLIGGLQDTMKSGVSVARVFWEYQKDERRHIDIDKPVLKLIPVENFRWDPAAGWIDPVNESPFVIELIPMYVCDLKEKMGNFDDKTGAPEWLQVPDQLILQAQTSMPDPTRVSREKSRDDPYDTGERTIRDYSIVWVQRHIHRRNGIDWEFYTLADVAMLTDPQPLQVSTWHGQRDYVIGYSILETHISFPSSLADLGKQLFDEINEIANQKLDNAKFVLNKKWIVRRNRNVDTSGLVRNVPGGVIMADDPEKDVRELTWPDITGSAYQEQDRLNQETDELLGNFNPVNLPNTGGKLADTVHGAQLLSAPSSMVTEFALRTYVESFVLPVLRLVVKLEQHYESDTRILALAGNNAKLFQKYGISFVSDWLLNQDLTVRVNVGMGATDPAYKLQKLLIGLNSFIGMLKNAPPGSLNLQEVSKEIFGAIGYQDGTRFLSSDNPAVKDLQMKLQQALQFIQQLGKQVNDKNLEANTKIEVAKIAAKSRVDARPGHNPMEIHEHLIKAHEVALSHEIKLKEVGEKMEKLRLDWAKFGLDVHKQRHMEKHPPKMGQSQGNRPQQRPK